MIVAFLFAGMLMHCSNFDLALFLTKNAITFDPRPGRL